MNLQQAREEHKKFLNSKQRLPKEVFIERYNNGEDVYKLIHTPKMFSVKNYYVGNSCTKKMREKLISYGIL